MGARQQGFQQNKDTKTDRARSNQAEYDLQSRASHPPPEACIISHPGGHLPITIDRIEGLKSEGQRNHARYSINVSGDKLQPLHPHRSRPGSAWRRSSCSAPSGSAAHVAGAQATTVHDPAALKPPPGARVAIVEFEDMECPDCARANPLLRDAATQYHIPWVRHDFPLPFHAWSFDAAVYARWFDTKSKKIGDDFRDAVFANQQLIDAAGETSPETPAGPTTAAAAAIRNFAEKFAQQHGIALPFVIDPQKKLAARGPGGPRSRQAHWHRAHADHLGRHQQDEWCALCRGSRPSAALPDHRPGAGRHQRPSRVRPPRHRSVANVPPALNFHLACPAARPGLPWGLREYGPCGRPQENEDRL